MVVHFGDKQPIDHSSHLNKQNHPSIVKKEDGKNTNDQKLLSQPLLTIRYPAT